MESCSETLNFNFLLVPGRKVLPGKLIVAEMFKKFPQFVQSVFQYRVHYNSAEF